MNIEGRRDEVSQLLHGVVDTHVHSGPSRVPRALDHIEMIAAASAAGYRAIVTKDHYYDGAPIAALVNAHYGDRGTRMYSGVVLNAAVGGLNAAAVEASAAIGGRAVWLPTYSARNHIRWQQNEAGYAHPGVAAGIAGGAVDVLTDGGAVVDDLKRVIDVVAEHDQVLISGHLHISEVVRVFDEARSRGVTRLLLLHPPEIVGASTSDVAQLARDGVFTEHSMNLFLEGSPFRRFEPELLREYVRAANVNRTVLASDLGQPNSIHPVDGMRATIVMCLDLGFSHDEVRQLTGQNASELFGI
ncbi:DUF6282 family protein [Gryllotalpicola reticulitermitis]|uniref:DUF6282 family protein n=1 Tax=Gryllotalpicola reticulitermitis TaxID=1184153 RepID=A0ABV8Q2K0_9MICO